MKRLCQDNDIANKRPRTSADYECIPQIPPEIVSKIIVLARMYHTSLVISKEVYTHSVLCLRRCPGLLVSPYTRPKKYKDFILSYNSHVIITKTIYEKQSRFEIRHWTRQAGTKLFVLTGFVPLVVDDVSGIASFGSDIICTADYRELPRILGETEVPALQHFVVGYDEMLKSNFNRTYAKVLHSDPKRSFVLPPLSYLNIICKCYLVEFSLKSRNIPCESFGIPKDVMKENVYKIRRFDEMHAYIREYYMRYANKLFLVMKAIGS